MRNVTDSSIGRALVKTRGYGFESRTETFLFSFHYTTKGDEEK